MTRREQRRLFSEANRVDLLEDDVDDLYKLHYENLAESKKHTVLLISILVSLVTACILMVLQVTVIGA